MERLQKSESALDKLLTQLTHEDERPSESFKTVQCILNVLLSAMARYYPPISFQAIDDNSFFVAKSSTRFEIVVCLKHLKSAHVCVEESNLPLGLALVKIPGGFPGYNVWKNFCVRSRFEKEYLSPNFLRSSISKLLSKLVEDIDNVRHDFHITDGIKIVNKSTVDNLSIDIHTNNVCYNIDLLPAIECAGVWPACARNWRTMKSFLQREKTQRILQSGVHLVAKPARVGFHWRIWFSGAESLMLQFDEFPCKRKCLRLLKKVVFGHLGCVFLSSYHLYTLLLHESGRFPEHDQWCYSQLHQRVRGVLLRLYQCLTTAYCQHFFITSLNLFRGISSSALEDFARRLQELLVNQEKPDENGGNASTARLCVYETNLTSSEVTVNTTWL